MSVNCHEPDLDTHRRDLDCTDASYLRCHLHHYDHRYSVRKAAYEACIFVSDAFWKKSSVIDRNSILSKITENRL